MDTKSIFCLEENQVLLIVNCFLNFATAVHYRIHTYMTCKITRELISWPIHILPNAKYKHVNILNNKYIANLSPNTRRVSSLFSLFT